MKKLSLLLLVTLIFNSKITTAQTLVNAGFENWTNVILFSMWTEAIKNFAEFGKGNVIFLDGSPEGMDKTMKQMMGLITSKDEKKS